jgi:hypothetical protein
VCQARGGGDGRSQVNACAWLAAAGALEAPWPLSLSPSPRAVACAVADGDADPADFELLLSALPPQPMAVTASAASTPAAAAIRGFRLGHFDLPGSFGIGRMSDMWVLPRDEGPGGDKPWVSARPSASMSSVMRSSPPTPHRPLATSSSTQVHLRHALALDRDHRLCETLDDLLLPRCCGDTGDDLDLDGRHVVFLFRGIAVAAIVHPSGAPHIGHNP